LAIISSFLIHRLEISKEKSIQGKLLSFSFYITFLNTTEAISSTSAKKENKQQSLFTQLVS